MQIPIEISYHNMDGSEWIDDYIKERAEHLDQVSGGITSCRVVVELTQHPHQKGNPFRVRVEATMPPQKDLIGDKEEIVDDREMQFRPIIRHAFDAVEKQAIKQREKMSGKDKQNRINNTQESAPPPTGVIARISQDRQYGFIQVPPSTDEYYFHRQDLLQGDFDGIEPGVQVRFEPPTGDDNAQASSVQLIDRS